MFMLLGILLLFYEYFIHAQHNTTKTVTESRRMILDLKERVLRKFQDDCSLNVLSLQLFWTLEYVIVEKTCLFLKQENSAGKMEQKMGFKKS
ncbi:unnamed protein product [Diamesa serratosioi]